MRPAAKGKGVRPAGNLFDRPAAADLIGLAAGERPRFWVTIDTEEDFDWSAPFARTGYRLDSVPALADCQTRSEEHTSELQSLMRISYAVFCLSKKTTLLSIKIHKTPTNEQQTSL